MNGAPTLSVIVPCWNAREFVGEAVESALGQRDVAVEVLVVDDGSTDGTGQVLAGFGDRIKVLTQPNRGRSAARNRGLREAKGEFVAFLDADDWWSSEFAVQMIGVLEESGAGIVYCGWQNVGLTGPRAKPFIPPEYEGPEKLALLLENTRWPIHAAVVRREVALAAGGFAEDLAYSEDFLFWLETAVRSRLARVPQVLAFYRHHRGNHLATHEARWALSHLKAQRRFLSVHPEVGRQLGYRKVRRLLYGELRRRAFTAYWARDLVSARCLFRHLMVAGYGHWKDWYYMLPSFLPLSLHKGLLSMRNDVGE